VTKLNGFLAALAAAVFLAVGCGEVGVTQPEAVFDAPTSAEGGMAQSSDVRLPFHSEMTWQMRQMPLPSGRCSEPLPEGLSYLWLTQLSGTAESTHLGKGPVEGTICIYGYLTSPETPPPGNGTPLGWQDGRIELSAANGDRLMLTARSTGVTAPPGTPGFKFVEEVRFMNGGSGRFRFATGEATGYVDPVTSSAVYDGWIRYGRTLR